MRARTIAGLIMLALAAGIAAGEVIYRSKVCRDLIAQFFGRGRLLTLINGRGIYESDVRREIEADRYLTGRDIYPASEEAVLKRLMANENLRQLSQQEKISETQLQRELDLLQYQFGDDKIWGKRLGDSGVAPRRLRELVRENLCGRGWLEHSLAGRNTVDEQAVRTYYAQHLPDFVQPPRFRASHIFLAAPPETPLDIVPAKKQLTDSLAARLLGGEEFDQLVWEASEDENTKPRAGDLGYFSESRIPHDFFSMVSQLKIGEPPKTFRSVLGFHIVRLTEMKHSRQIPFEEARAEIVARLTNNHRQEITRTVAEGVERKFGVACRLVLELSLFEA